MPNQAGTICVLTRVNSSKSWGAKDGHGCHSGFPYSLPALLSSGISFLLLLPSHPTLNDLIYFSGLKPNCCLTCNRQGARKSCQNSNESCFHGIEANTLIMLPLIPVAVWNTFSPPLVLVVSLGEEILNQRPTPA